MDINKTKYELKARIAKGLNYGIEAVEEILDPASKAFNQFILIKSKYNDLMHVSSMSTLAYDQIEIGLSKLRNGLLHLIDEMEGSHFKSAKMDPNIKKSDFPSRRTNFFKLLEIHFQNLESIIYTETMYSGSDDKEENIYPGRMAFHPMFETLQYKFNQFTPPSEGIEKETVEVFFTDYFKYDKGRFEVYFKNIKHMLSYIFEGDVEVAFFLNIFKSLFSRYESFFLFYYAVSGIDENFKLLIQKSGLIDSTVEDLLLYPAHKNLLS